MKEALKAAIKAMENSNSLSYEMMHAIADCKEALAQPDYRAVKTYHEGKPVYVSQPEQPTLQQQLEKAKYDWDIANADGYKAIAEITRIKKLLEIT